MYEELIRRLREEPLDSNKAALPIMDLCIDAATAIENLSHTLDMAHGERDAVTRHMIELEQETVAKCNGLNEPLTLDELREMDGEPVWWWNKSAKPVCTICVWDRFMNEPMFANYDWQSEDTLKLSKYKWLKKCGYKPYRQKPEEWTV